jgi:hypothetical protein
VLAALKSALQGDEAKRKVASLAQFEWAEQRVGIRARPQ